MRFMKQIFLSLILFTISATTFAQYENYTLQYGKSKRKVHEWKQDKKISLRTKYGFKYKGDLHIINENTIAVDSNIVPIDDIARISSFSLTETLIFGETSVFFAFAFTPVLLLSNSFYIFGKYPFHYKIKESDSLMVLEPGVNYRDFITPEDTVRIFPVKDTFNYFRSEDAGLFRYNKNNGSCSRICGNNEDLMLFSDNTFYKGIMQIVSMDSVIIGNKSLAIRDIRTIEGRSANSNRDTAFVWAVAGKYHKKWKNPVYQNMVARCRTENPPSEFIYFGLDFPKLFVPKFRIRAQYLMNNKLGFATSFGYKPLNRDGNGGIYTWRSNVDFVSESFQFTLNPFVWNQNGKKKYAEQFGLYYYYKYLFGDEMAIATFDEYYGWYYYDDIYWHNKVIHGLGFSYGIFMQKNMGFSFQLSLGANHVHSYGYYMSHGNQHNYSDEYWMPFADISIFFDLRFRKTKSPYKE